MCGQPYLCDVNSMCLRACLQVISPQQLSRKIIIQLARKQWASNRIHKFLSTLWSNHKRQSGTPLALEALTAEKSTKKETQHLCEVALQWLGVVELINPTLKGKMNGISPYQANSRHSQSESPYTTRPSGGVRRVEWVMRLKPYGRDLRLDSRKRGGGAATPQ